MNIKKAILSLIVASSGLLFPSAVFAQAQQNSLLPKFFQDIIDAFKGDQAATQVQSYITNGLVIIFVLVFVVAIAYSGLAAIKFITSQGEAQKLESSKAAVKAILMGFAAMIIAIVGIVIIVMVFKGDISQYPNCIPTNLLG